MAGADPQFDGVLTLEGGNYEVKGESQSYTSAIELVDFSMGAEQDLEEDFRQIYDKYEEIGDELKTGDSPDGLDLPNPKLEDAPDQPSAASQFHITKQIDSATVALCQAYCSQAKPDEAIKFPKGIVSIKRAYLNKPVEFMKLEFEDVQVIGYNFETQEDNTPIEKIDFSFRKVTFTFTPQGKDGALGSPLSQVWEFVSIS